MAVSYATVGEMLTKFARNGSTVNMNVNGSVTPVEFKVSSPTGFGMLVQQINFVIIDSVKVFEAADFGTIDALTNGLLIECECSTGSRVDILDGQPIKNNGQWSAFAGVDLRTILDCKGMSVSWPLSKATVDPVLIQSENSIVFTVQDNLTTLDEIYANVQGCFIPIEQL
jgi:hypothetical protein